MHPRDAQNPFQFAHAMADQAEAMMPKLAPALTYEVHDRGEPDYSGFSFYAVFKNARGWFWQPVGDDGETHVLFAIGPFPNADAAERAGGAA